MPDPYRFTFLDAATNHHAGDCAVALNDHTPAKDFPWGFNQTRLRGGKQEGVDLITLITGSLVIRVIPTRGMGILDVRTGGDSGAYRLGWDSPVQEIVHPNFIDLGARGGTGWLDGFNEYLVRCGLEFLGPPCEDTHHAAVGEPPAANTTLHGKIANTPASKVELVAEQAPPYRVTLRGVVHERSMYGPKLELATELSFIPGKPGFTLRDRITNRGGQTQECGILYHLNHGRPLLEKDAQLVTPAGTHATPRDAGYTDNDVERWAHYSAPRPASPEQVFFLDLPADENGETGVLLHSSAKDQAVSIRWLKNQLPHFALWKALHDERDGYVTGLEPCTTLPNPRPVERDAGRLLRLKPGTWHEVVLEFAVARDAAGVTQAIDRTRGAE
ncbi:DUF4432 family protein [Phycisphaeraceae bacterium D3-23]